MIFSDVIRLVSKEVSDVENVTYFYDQVRESIIDAERATILARNDASVVTENIKTVAGTKQSLPAYAIRLNSVYRNMGLDGATPGRGIRLVERETKDGANFNWHSETGKDLSKEYVYDDRDPTTLYVSPPSLGNHYIEVSFSREPTVYDFTEGKDPDLTVSDIYIPAIVEYAVYKLLSQSDDNTPDGNKANMHYQKWADLLSLKINSDVNTSPKQRSHLK